MPTEKSRTMDKRLRTLPKRKTSHRTLPKKRRCRKSSMDPRTLGLEQGRTAMKLGSMQSCTPRLRIRLKRPRREDSRSRPIARRKAPIGVHNNQLILYRCTVTADIVSGRLGRNCSQGHTHPHSAPK